MSLGFDQGGRTPNCRFCAEAAPPENAVALDVPYLRQDPLVVCVRCARDYRCSGWVLEPFAPRAEFAQDFLWPEPSAADVAAADEGPLREGVEAFVEARRRLVGLAREEEAVRSKLAQARPLRPLDQLWLREPELATLAFGLDPQLRALLLKAWDAFDEFLPSYTFTSALHARVAALHAVLTLQLGENAPSSYGPRKKGPAAWLQDLRDQARQAPALRDPRVPLLRALLYREEDNVGGLERELDLAQAWLEAARGASPEAAAEWSDVAFTIHYDLHVRANAGRRWTDARDHLKRCCALRPDAGQTFVRLAHAYVQCAQPSVAREVLAAKLGRARATDEAVQDIITRSLGELRPQLSAHQAAHPDEPLRLLYGACLQGLGELDEAWRLLEGRELCDELRAAGVLSEDEAALASASLGEEDGERLHLAGLIAQQRGDLEGAALLLAGAALASADPRIDHDLLCVVAQQARELLEDVAERTRESSQRFDELTREFAPGRSGKQATAEDRPEAAQERRQLRAGLAEDVLGSDPREEQGFLARPGLLALHALLRRHAALLLRSSTEYERGVFAGFLGRELGSWFRPLVAPPSLTDRADLRVSDAHLRIDLTYLALSKRRLPDAAREDRAARELLGHGAPLHLLLTYLELVRRGGPAVHAWAAREWARLPLRRAPLEAGLLIVTREALERREVGFLTELFDDPTRRSTVGAPSLRSLRGRCSLVFALEGDEHDPLVLARDPLVRGFMRALFDACPAFAFVLDLTPERLHFDLVFGALASPDALRDEAGPEEQRPLNVSDVSVLEAVRASAAAIRELAATLGMEAEEALRGLLSNYPEAEHPGLTAPD